MARTPSDAQVNLAREIIRRWACASALPAADHPKVQRIASRSEEKLRTELRMVTQFPPSKPLLRL